MPVLMLGAVSPWAIRLKLERIEDSARPPGRMYAISTVGSLLGTFLSALLLIPLVGTQRTFLTFALALAIVAALGLRAAWRSCRSASPRCSRCRSARSRRRRRPRDPRDRHRVPVRAGDRPPRRRAPPRAQRGPGRPLDLPPRPVLTGDSGTATCRPRSPSAPRRRAASRSSASPAARRRAPTSALPGRAHDGVEIDGELFDIGRRYFGVRGARSCASTPRTRGRSCAAPTRATT